MKRSEKLLQTIREQEIKPVPKAWFTLRNTAVWAGFAASVLLGALAFSVILFCIQQTDFNLVNHLTHSRLEFVLGLLPFFWIVALAAFVVSAMLSFKQAPRGYKFSTARLAAYNAALSILAGTLLFLAGGAQRLEHAFDIRVSLYESVQEKKIKIWSMPDEGYLSGTIIRATDSTLVLRDFRERSWTIGTAGAFVAPVVQLEPGEQVKLIGKKVDAQRFDAAEIRPWGGPGFHRRQGRQRGSSPIF